MKLAKKFVSLALCLLMLTGVFGMSSFATDDVPEGWIAVRDIDDLYSIRNNLAGNYILMNDIDLTDDLAEGGDYDSGNGWEPIGITATGCNEFTGIFDGNGHTLTGFRIDIKSVNSGYTGTYYSGLFGINSGTIKNLSFENAYQSTIDRAIYAGVIAGYNKGTIQNCNVDATCNFIGKNNINCNDVGRNIGMVVGRNYYGTISFVKVTGELNLSGLFGYSSYYTSATSTSSSYFYYTYVGNHYFGSVAGYSNGTINDSISYASISFNQNNNNAGYYRVFRSLYIGGLVGYGYSSSCKIERSCFCGETNLVSNRGLDYSDNIRFGGITGYLGYGKITDCYAVLNGIYDFTRVSGDYARESTYYIGGIVGYATGESSSKPTLTNVYSTGALKNVAESNEGNSYYIGGIAGETNYLTVNNSYYDSSLYTKGAGTGTDAATAKSPALMKKQSAYTGFDFDNTWIFYPCSSNPCPQLRSVTQDTSANNHSSKNPISKVDATCTDDGLIRGLCDNCGVEFTSVIPALGHEFSTEYTVDLVETCETAGSKSQHCSRCDETRNVTSIPSIGHLFSAWEPTTESNGCQEGTMARTCSNCNKTETKTYTAADHVSVTDAAKPATCTESGLTGGSHCAVCGKVFVAQETVEATGHKPVADTNAKKPTCTEDGNEAGVKCSVCNVVLEKGATIPATGHKEAIEKGTPATCTAAGKTDKKYCSVCNTVLEQSTVIKATGHKAGAPVSENVVDATCTKAGSYDSVVYCTVCNEEMSREAKVATLDHTPAKAVQENKVNATCTKAGSYDSVVYCSVCNSEISRDAKVIPALGHTYGSWVVTKAATETSEGLRVKTCSVCGDKVSEKIAKLPSTAKQTKIAIRNMSKYNGKTLDYKATITFYADVTDSAGNKIEWHVTGANKTLNSDGSCTIKQATKDFTISCSTKDANGKDVTSETETIKINTSFFGRIMSFFKGLFGKLPVYDQ